MLSAVYFVKRDIPAEISGKFATGPGGGGVDDATNAFNSGIELQRGWAYASPLDFTASSTVSTSITRESRIGILYS